MSSREEAENRLRSYGYSIREVSNDSKGRSFIEYAQKATAGTVHTVRIVRITSKGKVLLNYYEAWPKGLTEKRKRKAIMPVSKLHSLHESAKNLLSKVYPAGSTHYANVPSFRAIW